MYGCISESQANEVAAILNSETFLSMDDEDILVHRCVMVPHGENLLQVKSRNPAARTSVVFNTYQLGIIPKAEEPVVVYIVKCISHAAFNQLRLVIV